MEEFMAGLGNPNIDLIRKTLAVLLTAWNRKMQMPELIRGNVKPPVLNAETVTGWMQSLMGLRYMKLVDKVNGQNIYQEVAPDASDPAKLYRYQELTKRIGNPKYMENLAVRLNSAMTNTNVLENLLNKQFCSLFSMVLSDKSIKNDVSDVKTNTGRVFDGQQCWFTLDAVANKVDDLNKLKGHLCTYTLYDSRDVAGGRTGKVIVCPLEAGGIKNIPQRLAMMINQKLREKYNVDRDIAVVKPLSEITYKIKAGDEKNPRVLTINGVKGTGMTYGIDIDCSERIEVSGAFVDPRKAVSELFKSDELPITMTSVETHSTQSTEERRHDMDTDAENALANQVDANILRGHKMLSDQMDNSGNKQIIALIETRKSKLKTSVGVLNMLASALNGDGSRPDTAWKHAEFKTPEKSDDQYINFANYATSVSDYIIESTKGMFGKENAPFAFDVIFANRNVRFASNTIPKRNERITLDRYANTMNRILDAINANVSDSSHKLLVKNAKAAVSNLKLYEESVYQLLSPAIKTYVGADLEKVEEKRKASDIASTYQNAKINVDLMDKYTGFNLAKKYNGMVKGVMTLGEYLDNASAWVEKASESSVFGSDDVDNLMSEPLVKINTALRTLINGGENETSAAAVGVLDKAIHAAAATSKPEEKHEAPKKVEQPVQHEEVPQPEAPAEQPTVEPKPTEEPSDTDDDDLNDIDSDEV